MAKIKVLVVDDSALMREMLSRMLNSDPGIEVVGTAMDGAFALKKIGDLAPDVITLDVNMPRLDGIETLKRIIEDFGIPTIMVSSLATGDADLTLRALEIGAFDFVAKPQNALSLHIEDITVELIEKVKAAGENPRIEMKMEKSREITYSKSGPALSGSPTDNILAVGVSTGGPNALGYLLPMLPADFPVPIVISQHMPPCFTEVFAMRLNAVCGISVKEADHGDPLVPGRAFIAPGDRHLKVRKKPQGAIAILSQAPPVNGHRPSADVLFRSAAEEYGDKATGLIMTGMGVDGADAIGEIKKGGGLTIAQDEKSCVVFGMPKAAIHKQHVNLVVSLEDMADTLINYFCRKEEAHGKASHPTKK